MIIVAGYLRVTSTNRDTVLAHAHEAIRLARGTPGCQDFALSPDPIDPERVNVYERWTDRTVLNAFRGRAPENQLDPLIGSVHVAEFEAHPMK